jgi:hypothetical protein
MFPLRERKLDVLNARLDQLKNDLHLMLSIVKNRNDLKAAVERRDHLEQRRVANAGTEDEPTNTV